MANETVNDSHAAKTGKPTSQDRPGFPKKPREFFSMCAAYHVDPEATAGQLLDDLGGLLTAALAVLESLDGYGDGSSAYVPALYLLRQANAVHRAAGCLVGDNWAPKADSEVAA